MSLLLALFGLSLVIIAHELGHYLGAVIGGMRVKQFALGFGRRLLGWRRGETEYRLNLLPFGAYVMVDGETEASVEPSEDPRKMENRPFWARTVFILGGPFLNFALAALLILAAVGLQGLPAGRSVGVSEVVAGSPAAAAGLRAGDLISAVDGRRVAAAADLSAMIKKAGGAVALGITREGKSTTIAVAPHDGRIGIMMYERVLYSRRGMSLPKVVSQAWQDLSFMANSVFGSLAMLLTGRAGLRDLSGPVGMVKTVTASAAFGPAAFLLMLAFISVNLGLFNLIPIPALDGGRFLLLAVEKAIGRKLSWNLQAGMIAAGFALLILLIAFVSVQDVLRLIRPQ